jgi:hypothetical protein
MFMIGTSMSIVRSAFLRAVVLLSLVGVGCVPAEEDGAQDVQSDDAAMPALSSLEAPTFHHVHINSANPVGALDWWKTIWPAGEITTYAGFPAFAAQDIYYLYTTVDTQAPGGFDSSLYRGVPQSAFWTTGPSTDGTAFYERLRELDPASDRFEFLPVYTGPDDVTGVPHSGLAPWGDRLLTVAQLEELADTPPERNANSQDFGYLVDPDGILVEFNGNRETDEHFYGHLHFWHEEPLCAVNWYVEHLGVTIPPLRDPDSGELVPRPLNDPCTVGVGPVSYPTFFPGGQLRQPSGLVLLANTSWFWYPRQCRVGRCGEGEDRPLSPSRGQVVDHMGLTFSDLDAVLAHLAATGVPVVEGPYPFGDTRAVLIEDLDGLALELIEMP